jgi:hypothetical protein
VSLRSNDVDAIREMAAEFGVSCREVGTVGGGRLTIPGVLDLDLEQMANAWELDV